MKVLLTGATGYIGRRLKVRLLEDGDVDLRLFVRNIRKVSDATRARVDIVEGSSFDREALRRALDGVEVAYYLIHSMGARGDFRKLDRLSAENFREACIEAGVKRIIYLGGLGRKECASRHLLSRIETGEVLSARPDRVQTIWLRAGIIIGSGSASFEILWNYVEKTPLMVLPRSIATMTEPIGIDDVLCYLSRARHIHVSGDLVVDIGSGVMSYHDILMQTASVIGVKRRLVTIPLKRPRVTSYLLSLVFPVPWRITSSLLQGLYCETVACTDAARRYFPGIRPVPFEEAMRRAVCDIENNQVLSRWSDSSGGEACDVKGHDEIAGEVLVDSLSKRSAGVSTAGLYRSIMAIGGENGWFTYHFLWEVRGFFDKLIGGYGISRGRRDRCDLRVGDSLDFWKVADIQENRRLLLVAQMKLPGKAWLEFAVGDGKLAQTAYFLPHGLWGYVYWYLMKPVHFLIFHDMARNIIRRAREMDAGARCR